MKFPTFLSVISSFISITEAAETCYLPIDVVFVQDTTGSFEDDLPNVVSQIPSMVQQILDQNPESYFGVTEFKDKPYYPLGELDDFCYKLDGALTPDVATFKAAYATLYASGGGDLPESTFQALVDAAIDGSVGWRSISRPVRASEAGARLIILSTDAVPHLPGDIDRMYPDYTTVPHNLPPFNPSSSFDTQCRNQDYPSPEQIQAALQAQNIYLAILTPNDPAIVPSWTWVNENLLGQPSDFYQFISSDSSDIIQGVLAAIQAVTETACAETLPPPTSAPTTETPTTPTTTTEATTTPTTTTPTTTTEATTTPTTTTPTTTTEATTTPITTTPTTTAETTTPATTTPTTTTVASTTSAPTTPAPATSTPILTTTQAATITPIGTAETTGEASPSKCPPCPQPPCPPCPPPCHPPCHHGHCDPCCWDVVIKISDRPDNVHIEMGNDKTQ